MAEWSLFARPRVQTRRSTIQTELFSRFFLSPAKQMRGYYLKIGHDLFLPNPFLVVFDTT
jgi:hypothetical protein